MLLHRFLFLCYNPDVKGTTKTILKQPYLNYNERQVLKAVIQRLPSMYPMINKIVLYGSKARGDFVEESDIDILFVTDYPIHRTLKTEIYDMIYELEVEYNVVFSVIFINKEAFESKNTSFIKQVYREGNTLWSRE